VFDFALRLRTAGTSVSFTYIRPMPVPPGSVVDRLPRIPTRLAWECGLKHITDDRDAWPLLWDANRGVAEAYSLTPDDFGYAVFGKVIDGMDTVDKIASVKTAPGDVPVEAVVIKSIKRK